MRHDPQLAELFWQMSDGEPVLGEALDVLSRSMDGARMVVGALDPGLSAAGLHACASIDDSVGARLWGDLATPAHNPALPYLIRSDPGHLLHYRPWIPWDVMRRSALYADVLVPAGVEREAAGMRLAVPGHGDLLVYFGLRHGRDWLDRDGVVRAQVNLRALGRAIGLGLDARIRAPMPAPHATAAFVLAWDGQLLSRAGQADDLIEAGTFLRLQGGYVEWTDAAASQILGPLLDAARAGRAERGTLLRDGRALLLSAQPGASFRNSPTIALTAVWARPIEWSPHSLSIAYGLTRREAEVTLDLLRGLPPVAIGHARGIKVASVRMYLKRIFAKTETCSQVTLMAHLFRSN